MKDLIQNAIKKKSSKHIQEVKDILCTAIADGYYGGIIVKPGKKFRYSGPLKDGKFPQWAECDDKKFESDFSKLVDHVPEKKDINLGSGEEKKSILDLKPEGMSDDDYYNSLEGKDKAAFTRAKKKQAQLQGII